MANRIIRVANRELLDFSGLSALGTATMYLARRIDVARFREVTAYLRFHQGTNFTPLNSSDFIINADGYTEEDPGANDPSANPAYQTPVVTTSVVSAATTGGMIVIPVPLNFGSLLSISWSVTPAVFIGVTVRYVVSVDLICKEF